MSARDPRALARDAWRWLAKAEKAFEKADSGSPAELQAIQAMSAAVVAALTAEKAAGQL